MIFIITGCTFACDQGGVRGGCRDAAAVGGGASCAWRTLCESCVKYN